MRYDVLQSQSSTILNEISASVQKIAGLENLTGRSETFTMAMLVG
jgi:hypothetical protein